MRVSENNHRKEDAGTLTAKIQETERRLWDRQLRAHVHTNALIKDLKKELASPTTLLLASELGFIVGELTKRPQKSEQISADHDHEGVSRADTTPLKEALDFSSLLITLFNALPPTWIMETFHPEKEDGSTQKTQTVAESPRPKARVDLSKGI